ncbi:MAG: hypothetical protein ACE14V_09725 [bacterium]
MTNSKPGIYFIFLIFIPILIAAMVIGIQKGPELIGHYDGVLYFVYLRSAVIDHNLNFDNDYQLLKFGYTVPRTPDGKAVSVMPFGIAILWFPFYLLAHVLTFGVNICGLNIPLNGISPPYILSIIIATWIYGLLGVILCYKLCCRHYPALTSGLAVITIFLSSFLLYYIVYDPFFAHIGSFFSVTSFIYYWYITFESRSIKRWVYLGGLAGLMVLVRWQNIVFIIFPTIDLLIAIATYIKTKPRFPLKELLILYLSFIILFVITAGIPQLLVWKKMYGIYPLSPNDLTMLRGGEHYLLWHYPAIEELLFSTRNGLFTWSPLAMLGTIGFIFFYKKDTWLTGYLWLSFAVMVYVNSSVADWWGGGGFGMRRFDGFIILFSLGIATLIAKFKMWIQKYPITVIGIMLLAFISWNFALIRQYSNRQISPGDTVSWKNVTNNQIQYISRKLGYPFSYPANLWFSMKYHTSPEKYDIVAGKYLDFWDFQLHSTIEFSSIDEAFLNSGWSFPQNYGDIPVRWSNKPESSLFITLRYPAEYIATIQVLPFTYPQAPRQTITVIINRYEVTTITLENQWKEYTFSIPKKYLRPGVNELKFKYAYVMEPFRVDSTKSDSRPLAVCWHTLKFKRVF